jgi:ABC-type Fe3+-citrate transport system substrate-binding protein
MRSKIILSSVLVLSVLFLSGCTIKNKNQSTNQPTPTIVNNETGDDSESDILKELNSTSTDNSDSQLNQIESELK